MLPDCWELLADGDEGLHLDSPQCQSHRLESLSLNQDLKVSKIYVSIASFIWAGLLFMAGREVQFIRRVEWILMVF